MVVAVLVEVSDEGPLSEAATGGSREAQARRRIMGIGDATETLVSRRHCERAKDRVGQGRSAMVMVGYRRPTPRD